MKIPRSILLFEHRVRKGGWLFRGLLLTLYLRLHGCHVGAGLKCKMFPDFRQVPNANIIIGKNVNIGYRVMFDVVAGAMLTIGDHVNLTQDLLISCGSEIIIGAYSGVAEYSSIRDGEHGIAASHRIYEQPLVFTPIQIGQDVQISRGCIVLGGAVLEDGAVLGANSVAGRNFHAIGYGIYFGVPPKLIGKRIS